MSRDHKKNKIRVGISVGDLNGIGVEVILKAFSDNRMYHSITPVVYASSKVMSEHKKALQLDDTQFHSVKDATEAVAKKLNVVNAWDEDVELTIGKPSNKVGSFALASLEAATKDLAGGRVDVLVTAPIDKQTIQSRDFDFPGHTEYLAKMANEDDALMFMVAPALRVGVVTGHIPLKDVAGHITKELVLRRVHQINNSLIRDFGIARPKIAVLGLNPHAGEKGMLGEEEKKIIIPALDKAKEEGIMALGPFPTDGFFGSSQFKGYDAVLAMYHDQGLAPFKALSFGMGVNYTAGLPIVRTSPDHGTAYEIAGQNVASADSFRHAVYLACDIYGARKLHREITADPLLPQTENKNNS